MVKWVSFFAIHGLMISIVLQTTFLGIDPPELVWMSIGAYLGELAELWCGC